jgi:DNA helicase HerA-like ATPase
MADMKIHSNDRVLLAGKTGSGKTWLAEHLLNRVDRLVVIDPKDRLTHWRLDVPSERDWRDFDRGEAGRFRLVSPIQDNTQAWYEDQFARLYTVGNLIVYIDEAYGVLDKPGARPGKWLSAMYTRGRELGIGTWAATQRPSWIPGFLMSEADILIVFRLNMPDDRKKLAEIGGEALSRRVPDTHGFYLYRLEDDSPTYFKTAELGAIHTEPVTSETV